MGVSASEIFNLVHDAAAGVVYILHGIVTVVSGTWNNFCKTDNADGIVSNFSIKYP